ncbi:polysaccharide biosynthesis protein [Francisella tularensis]|nr:polysaccharide biosynthesis protein [Francisella tularensis]
MKNYNLGSINAIGLAIEAGEKSVIVISTDKSVRQTNDIWANKRVCALYLHNF